MSTDPSLSLSNILNAAEKLDSWMLSRVTKKIYLFQLKIDHYIMQTHIERDRC